MKKAKLKKTESFIEEFKKFITRGNVIDLAVGVIIGGAFQKIINSLVNDLIMPVVGLFTGGINFNDRFLALDGNAYESIAAAKAAGAATFNYGSFITEVLNFLIMAFVIFLLVKGLNKLSNLHFLKKPGDAEPKKEKPTTKKCPYCLSEIPIEATRCPHCTSQIETASDGGETREDENTANG